MKIGSPKNSARWVGLTLATLQCSGLVHAQGAEAPSAAASDAAKAKADKDASTPQTRCRISCTSRPGGRTRASVRR